MRAANSHFINGKCSECGECCGNLLPLSGADIKRLRRYIKKHKISKQNDIDPLRIEVLQDCVFLKKDLEKRCAVYPARPEICRMFNCDNQRHGILPGDIKKYKVHNMYTLLDDILKE